jgi:uncharacterized protein YndB with AHSA1/START domain
MIFAAGEGPGTAERPGRPCAASQDLRTGRSPRCFPCRTQPETVYRAFVDSDAMAKWLPPNGFTGRVHEMDAKVGGTYKMSFTNFTTGHSHSFSGEFLELVPARRIRYVDRFDDPKLGGELHTAVALTEVPIGTELAIVQEGIPDLIPREACYLGWQESLVLLGKLVEAEIPD